MAKGDSSDILMKFVLDGTAIEGESTTTLDVPGKARSRLLAGFGPSRMFELDSFTFSVGIEEEGGGGGTGAAAKKAAAGRPPPGRGPDYTTGYTDGHTVGHNAGRGITRQASLGGFSAWRSGTPHKKYPVSVQPISFTRAIDRASTNLMTQCIKCTSFDSVSLVKRKSAGSASAGEPYLRLDFIGVLITDIAWSNDDPVKETVKFISRSVTVRYAPQLPDGSLGAPRVGFWSMLPWEKEAPLR